MRDSARRRAALSPALCCWWHRPRRTAVSVRCGTACVSAFRRQRTRPAAARRGGGGGGAAVCNSREPSLAATWTVPVHNEPCIIQRAETAATHIAALNVGDHVISRVAVRSGGSRLTTLPGSSAHTGQRGAAPVISRRPSSPRAVSAAPGAPPPRKRWINAFSGWSGALMTRSPVQRRTPPVSCRCPPAAPTSRPVTRRRAAAAGPAGSVSQMTRHAAGRR